MITAKLIGAYKFWQEISKNFPKTSRFTLAKKIDDLFLKLAELSFIVSYLKREQKPPLIEKIAGQLDLLKFFLQIAWEIKALDNKKYERLSLNLREIGRMIGGWKNNLKKMSPAKPKT